MVGESNSSESRKVENACVVWSNNSISAFILKRNSSTCAQEVNMVGNNLNVHEKGKG